MIESKKIALSLIQRLWWLGYDSKRPSKFDFSSVLTHHYYTKSNREAANDCGRSFVRQVTQTW
jgi:hypothetical protein